ncbi:hypothetical protein SAMN04489732_1361 [Amycolatopsis saalfeldensis]|uniref:Uncharacterized protein n=1 Tax=Amycolatopsis saalfeldensis TaxID=394193 RepID=A0A1H8YPB2_9PSEU|nr:hypothetical protein SAMN04489732_1361 [Amycolatopsis saalfeldensis]
MWLRQSTVALGGTVEVDVIVRVRIKTWPGVLDAEVDESAVVRATFEICVLSQLGRICGDQGIFLR